MSQNTLARNNRSIIASVLSVLVLVLAIIALRSRKAR